MKLAISWDSRVWTKWASDPGIPSSATGNLAAYKARVGTTAFPGGRLARLDHGAAPPSRGREARPRRSSTMGDRGTGLRIVHNQNSCAGGPRASVVHAATDVDRLSGHEARSIGSEKERRGGDLVRLADPPQWPSAFKHLPYLGIAQHGSSHVGPDEPRCNRVDPDVVPAEIPGEALGEFETVLFAAISRVGCRTVPVPRAGSTSSEPRRIEPIAYARRAARPYRTGPSRRILSSPRRRLGPGPDRDTFLAGLRRSGPGPARQEACP